MRRVILDTGPLVAWLCPRDEHHAWVQSAFREIMPGSLTCEAVLTETCHLAAKEALPRGRVLEFIQRLRLQVAPLGSKVENLHHLLNR